MAVDQLVRDLAEKQRQHGKSNTEFARLLGVHRMHWIAVKMGRMRAGPKVELGAERLDQKLDAAEPTAGDHDDNAGEPAPVG